MHIVCLRDAATELLLTEHFCNRQKKEGEGTKVYEIVEEDDEFEEFEDEGWMDRKEEDEEKHYWADDWDNDDVNEEFAAQLRQELAVTAK